MNNADLPKAEQVESVTDFSDSGRWQRFHQPAPIENADRLPNRPTADAKAFCQFEFDQPLA